MPSTDTYKYVAITAMIQPDSKWLSISADPFQSPQDDLADVSDDGIRIAVAKALKVDHDFNHPSHVFMIFRLAEDGPVISI